MRVKFPEVLGSVSKWLLLLACIVLTAGIGYLDAITGVEFSFSIFYLFPVGLAAWLSGLKGGMFISILCSSAWFIDEVIGKHVYSHPLVPYWNGLISLLIFVVIVLLINRLHIEIEKHKKMSLEDFLTKTANSRAFYAAADVELYRMKRNGSPLTIAYMDLDNFKQVNDTKGHNEGDKVLFMLAGILKKHVRVTDSVARLGGDEFAILLPALPHESAGVFMEQIKTVVDEEMRRNGWPVTISAGVVTYVKAPRNTDAMIRLADSVMYDVKKSGKNRIQYIVSIGDE